MPKYKRVAIALAICAVMLILSTAGLAANALPDRTTDGLVLKKRTETGGVYVSEGANLSGYDKVAVTDVTIAFKKNWQRDHNRDIRALANRVTDQDMQAIKQEMADRFYTVFETTLNENGWPTTNEAASDVLLVQPSIVNLDIYAPAVNPAGAANTYVSEAGEMTLVLELFDSVTSAIIARAIDSQLVGENAITHQSSKSANITAYEGQLKGWATRLVDGLNRAKQAAGE